MILQIFVADDWDIFLSGYLSVVSENLQNETGEPLK